MNDFTKEELIDIYWKFEHYFDSLDGLVKESDLMIKIQCMIDNYCDQDYRFAGDMLVENVVNALILKGLNDE